MTDGQFNRENKHTEMFFQAKKDHLDASQMKNALTITSEDHANSKGFFCMVSHKDDNSYIEYISPSKTVRLDTTRTSLTGVAKLTVTIHYQEQSK